MSNLWLSWDEIKGRLRGRPIVFFGAAEVYIRQSLPNLDTIAFVVDNDPNEQNSTVEGIAIKAPSVLDRRSGEFFVIITSGSYDSIGDELLSYGFRAGEDFACCPVLDNVRILEELYSRPQKLLLTTQDHSFYRDAANKTAGGLYELDTLTGAFERKIDGNFRQICRAGDRYLIVDELRGPLAASLDYRILARFGGAETAKACGIDYDAESNLIFVANSKRDVISVYDGDSYALVREIAISPFPKKSSHNHHINDLCVHEGYLYVSMFSLAGCLQQWAMDGGVVQIDIDTPEYRFPIDLNAYMPHSIKMLDGKLAYVESMPGRVMRNPRHALCEIPGFVRGFCRKDGLYYIGQSEFRYLDRVPASRSYTLAEPGVHVFSERARAGRFISLPGLRQIHDVMLLDEADRS